MALLLLLRASGVTHDGAASVSGLATTAVAGERVAEGAGSLSGVATVPAAASILTSGAGSLTGVATVTPGGTTYQGASASISGLATVAAGATTYLAAAASVSGVATVAAAAGGYISGSSSLSATATIAGASVLTHGATASLSGVATVTTEAITDRYATASVSGVATLSRPVAALFGDTFTRSGAVLGTADTGGAWTEDVTASGSPPSDFATDGAEAVATLGTVGTMIGAALFNVSTADFDATVRYKLDKVVTGASGFAEIFLSARTSGTVVFNDGYAAHVLHHPTEIHGNFNRISATGVRTGIPAGGVLIPSSGAPAADLWYLLRFQIFDASPSLLKMKHWREIDGEPAAWTFTTTDSVGNQGAGAVGFRVRADSGNTNPPIAFTLDDYRNRLPASTAAALTLSAAVSATGVASAAVLGAITTTGAGSLAGVATLSGAASQYHDAAAAITGTATVTGTGLSYVDAAASITATASISGAGYFLRDGAASLSASASVTGAAGLYLSADASITGEATADLVAIVDIGGMAEIIGTATVTGTAESVLAAAGLLEGFAFATSDAQLILDAAGDLTGVASIIGALLIIRPGRVALSDRPAARILVDSIGGSP